VSECLVYRIHYQDDRCVDHELGRYITERELDPHRDQDRYEIEQFIVHHYGQDQAQAWLRYAPGMADSGLERIE